MIAIDPVCKMEVETETAQWKHEHEGETYYFCAPGCMGSFKHDPDKYLTGGGFIEMDHSGHDHADHAEHDHSDHGDHDHSDHSDHDHSH